MSILNKYLIKNIITGYLFILLIFVGLYFIIDLFSTLSDLLKSKPPITAIANYYLNMIPLIFLRVSPFALLISILYAFGELNKNNEIVSMRASGISIFKIALPVLFLSLFISFFSLYVQENILVNSQKKVEDIKIKYIKKKTSPDKLERNLAFPSANMIFFVQRFYPGKGVMEDITIFEENKKGQIIKKTICSSLEYEENAWVGSNVMEYHLDESGSIIDKPKHWPKKEIPLTENPKELVFKRSLFSQFTPLKTLKKEKDRLKKIKAYNILSGLTIDYHRKIAEPFTHFFLILCVLPFALEIKKRKVALSSLGTGFIFGFIYYGFVSFSIALGKAGAILPIFSAWLAPIFFITVGITGLILVK